MTSKCEPDCTKPHKVCIIGSGNWASAICRIVGENVLKYPDLFEPIVAEWVFEEIVDGKKITEMINNDHVNVKYLPGVKLPENIVAIPSLVESVQNATILVFVVPHQFLENTCAQIKGKIAPNAVGISLIKGIIATETRMQLISETIAEMLGIRVSVLMGANLASEVAAEYFCEATIASENKNDTELMKKLFEASYFRITTVRDFGAVELCGALKNIVAMGAGFSDAMGFNPRSKGTIIRLGFMEIIKFVEIFHPGSDLRTFYQSSGIADVIATCYGGRNRLVAEAFVKNPEKTIPELEKELLNGQRLQGAGTAAEVNVVIKRRGLENQFPFFTAVHKICTREMPPGAFIDSIRNHPEFTQPRFRESEFTPDPQFR